MKSNFASDLEKERKLSVFLDACYAKGLKNYGFKRVRDRKRQFLGIDLLFTHNQSRAVFSVDEKAQLDYINEDLPTFAFELQYEKNNVLKKGWLFDANKKTEFYSLITGIYSDEPEVFTSCKITFVNRERLIDFLAAKSITENALKIYLKNSSRHQGKIEIEQLHPKKEGYLYFSKKNKAEKPINLILKLDFLLKNGIAKRFL